MSASLTSNCTVTMASSIKLEPGTRCITGEPKSKTVKTSNLLQPISKSSTKSVVKPISKSLVSNQIFKSSSKALSLKSIVKGVASSGDGLCCDWDLNTTIAEGVECDVGTIRNVVRLLDDDNTIPFIARYRRDETNGMEPEKLREVKERLDELREVQAKIVKVVTKVDKLGKLDPKLKTALLSSRTADEVEHLYAPFKSSSVRTLAQRARDVGLESYALHLMTSPAPIDLRSALNAEREGLTSLAEIEKGVQHIIADIIAKDKDTMDQMRQAVTTAHVMLCSKTSKASKLSAKASKETGKALSKGGKSNASLSNGSTVQADKFDQYRDFSCSVRLIKPHQVLAINRGESLKHLTVSVEVPDQVRRQFLARCEAGSIPMGADVYCRRLIVNSAEDAYRRLILPLLTRSVRTKLNETAEKASISVFANNLKNLLLTKPVRGKCILAVDPGFSNGCKYALISAAGKIEATGVAYLHSKKSSNEAEMDKIRRLMLSFRCETVAIGNGVGCRETESLFADCIRSSFFHPLNVVFCIVNEAGASIYSASEEAKKEMPELDIAVRGAVSIARRLQDPLAELIKIEPKNIGVGMYQHDVSERKLQVSLDGVVEDCVSFVGADLNVANEVLLRHVAGIGASIAKKIVMHRETRGLFLNRSQLMNIAGLGPKTFKQCAGFLRIVPGSHKRRSDEQPSDHAEDAPVSSKRKRTIDDTKEKKKKKMKLDIDSRPNPYDMTWIHPESYAITDGLIQRAGLNKEHVGQPEFVSKFAAFIKSYHDVSAVSELAAELFCSSATLKQIVDGLMQPVGHDIRDDHEKPLFKQSVTSMADLKPGMHVSGKVMNVTHFGAFVDIGVGKDALLHNSGLRPVLLRGKSNVDLGDVIEAIVSSLDPQRDRIGLRLIGLVSGGSVKL